MKCHNTLLLSTAFWSRGWLSGLKLDKSCLKTTNDKFCIHTIWLCHLIWCLLVKDTLSLVDKDRHFIF